MSDQPQTELDEILREYLTACTNTDGDTWSQEEKIAEAKQAIQAIITQAKKDLLAEVMESIPESMGEGLQPMYSKGYNNYRTQALAAIDEIEEKL